MNEVKIYSTTDTPEQVTAASGKLEPKKAAVESKPAASESKAETTEDSGTTETETEELEAASGDGDGDDTSEGDDSKEAKDQDGKPKKKSGFKRKIDKLTKRNAEARQEADFWKAEALKAQAKESQAKPEAAAKSETSTEGKPDSKNFSTHDEYVEALADWRYDQREKATKAKEREATVKTEQQKRIATHVEKLEAFKKDHADFEDVIEDIEDVPMSVAVQEAILTSDNGPELMYELAKNRKEYERICKLPPLQAAKEIGKFEAKLEKPTVTDALTGKTTKAPPPLAPIGSKKAAPTKKVDDMTYQEYKKHWAETHRRA